MERIDQTMNEYLGVLDNEYVSSAVTLVLILYASLAAPKLPENVAKLFDNTAFKLVIFFLIAYTAKKSPTVAAVSAAGVMISLQTLNRYEVNKKMVEVAKPTVMGPGDEKSTQVHNQEPTPVSEVPIEAAAVPTISSESVPDVEEFASVDSVCTMQTAPADLSIYEQKNADGPVTGFEGDDAYATLRQ